MKVIGVTGGVGAGKSKILDYIKENYNVKVVKADEIGSMLMGKGQICYFKIVAEFGTEILDEEMDIDKEKMANLIFNDENLRDKINNIVHPEVFKYAKSDIKKETKAGEYDAYIFEAALILGSGYEPMFDDIWYIYSSEEIRKIRLKVTRKYDDEKIESIFKSQLSDEEFRDNTTVQIDNEGNFDITTAQVDEALSGIPKKARPIKAVAPVRNNVDVDGKEYVFGLDIGTRNVVGTVGYMENESFHIVAMKSKQHETRAMIDGQIHDITKVGKTVRKIKDELEKELDMKLTQACIAAAGRVLRTVTTTIDIEFEQETLVTGEHIHTLDLLGIEKAQKELNENNDTKFKFYCVGYTVIKYYLNGDIISNLESHKAEKISEEIIVTFLPEDVVDGLYAAVKHADMEVANLTLEPIAAINIAIPQAYRMLNIALVDVGAGTSDISITRDGSIIAYGMIPHAGDEITEILVQHYLVDFKTAEYIKIESGRSDTVTYKDIMAISHEIESKEVWELTKDVTTEIAKEVSDKIMELNGGEPVSAVFVVGGGGKVHGFVNEIAKELEIMEERVALRGEEVLDDIDFIDQTIEKDPLIVTPIGICLNYYEQRNSFIFVHFNNERIKIYNNNKLTVVDAAMEAGFPNDYLFPRRGAELNFTINGKQRIIMGELGESSVVCVNGREVSLSTPIENNDEIVIKESTKGADAHHTISQLPEHQSTLKFIVNDVTVVCPCFAQVNGELESEYYEIMDGDDIVMRNYYTVEQLFEFMDIAVDYSTIIYVNNKVADLEDKVYENFSVECSLIPDERLDEVVASEVFDFAGLDELAEAVEEAVEDAKEVRESLEDSDAKEEVKEEETKEELKAEHKEELVEENTSETTSQSLEEVPKAEETTDVLLEESKEEVEKTAEADTEKETVSQEEIEENKENQTAESVEETEVEADFDEEKEVSDSKIEDTASNDIQAETLEETKEEVTNEQAPLESPSKPKSVILDDGNGFLVLVNGEAVDLKEKKHPIFIDVFDYIDFDLSQSNGRAIITKINGLDCGSYSEPLKKGDKIDIYWKERI